MSSELSRRARRAEAGATRADDRRRLRLEFFRAILAEGLDVFKARHAEGASGQESVRSHARLIDGIVQALTRLIGAPGWRPHRSSWWRWVVTAARSCTRPRTST
jgi:hypothetical protein